MTEPLISITGAVKTFDLRNGGRRITALDHVDVSLERGKTLGVVGESGSGKSTLGRALLRLIDLDEGAIRFDGVEIQSMSPGVFRPLRSKLQMVFQNPATSFNPGFTIEDTLVDAMQLVPGLTLGDRRDRVRKLLSDVELSERFLHLYPHEMSGGQLQRVAIARALAPEPLVVFLDEPTAALDMSVRGQVLNMLRSLQVRRDMSFMLVSHDLRVIRGTADKVIVMYLGQVVEEAPRQAIFERPLHPYSRALLSAVGSGPREMLKGEALPQSGDTGCRLIGRCPFATRDCRAEQTLTTAGLGHRVRCWQALELPRFQKELV